MPKTTKKDDWNGNAACVLRYDAGRGLYISPNIEEINKEAKFYFRQKLKKGENARMEGLFTEAQKRKKLRDSVTSMVWEEN